MASRIINPSLTGIWIKKEVATWPVIGCISVAIGWTTYMSARHLFTSPDVSIMPTARSEPLKFAQGDVIERSSAWVSGHGKYIAKDHSKIRIFGSFETKA